PKSSDSINVSEIAAQLTATNGFAARGLCWCKSLATTSFPVPVSPVISTDGSTRANFSILPFSSLIVAEEPMKKTSSWPDAAKVFCGSGTETETAGPLACNDGVGAVANVHNCAI